MSSGMVTPSLESGLIWELISFRGELRIVIVTEVFELRSRKDKANGDKDEIYDGHDCPILTAMNVQSTILRAEKTALVLLAMRTLGFFVFRDVCKTWSLGGKSA